MVELLLRSGATKNISACQHALSHIVYHENSILLRLLLDYQVSPYLLIINTPLLIAIIKKKWITGLSILLDKNYNLCINDIFLRGETALYIAITNQLTEMVQLLLQAGANTNTLIRGISPLAYSCMNETSLAITRLLIEYGANVNGYYYNETVLMTAIKTGNIQCIKLLLRSGAKIHNIFELEECVYHIRRDVVRFEISQLLEDVALSTMTSWYVLEVNMQCIRVLDYDIWYKLLSRPTQDYLNNMVYSRKKDESACYTALYEGEDAVLKKFRQGEMVFFSEAKIRGIVRPMGMRHVRKLLTSYLIYPHSFRNILTCFERVA